MGFGRRVSDRIKSPILILNFFGVTFTVGYTVNRNPDGVTIYMEGKEIFIDSHEAARLAETVNSNDLRLSQIGR